MDKFLEPILGALLFVCFIYLIIWTCKFLKVSIDKGRVNRSKKAQKKQENIKLRTIGCAKNYWYNKQDVEDRPEGRTQESYYHYFEKAEDCIKDLIIEMYDCGIVRTELLEAIAYSGGMVGKEAKDYVQNLHNDNVVAAKEEQATIAKSGASADTIQIPVVDWDVEDLLQEKLAEAENRIQHEALMADEVLKEAERILNKESSVRISNAYTSKELKPSKRKTDNHKTAMLGKSRLEADKRNRILKEQFEAEDKQFLADELGIENKKKENIVAPDPEAAKAVNAALEESLTGGKINTEADLVDEVKNIADDSEFETEEQVTEPVAPMTKEEREAFEKNILIQTAVYENWVSYVFQLYEIININANEEIRNEIRIALMDYGHNDVEVLLHSPD